MKIQENFYGSLHLTDQLEIKLYSIVRKQGTTTQDSVFLFIFHSILLRVILTTRQLFDPFFLKVSVDQFS